MIDRQLSRRLEPVAGRLRRLRLSTGLAMIWMIAAIVAGVAWSVGPVSSRFVLGLILTTCGVAAIYSLLVGLLSYLIIINIGIYPILNEIYIYQIFEVFLGFL